MGFRDVEKFNQALLAKQVWRYMENPNALWAKVVKGIYFPKKEMREAKKGCHPSWFWSSFLHGRELIEENALWKMGNGNKIRVWEDRWIPGLEKMKINSENAELAGEELKVERLIDKKNKSWLLSEIEEKITPEEKDVIRAVHLPVERKEDKQIWPFTKK